MANRLEHLTDFKKVLQGYHISPESQKVLAQVKLVLLAAPSSSGRNTIIRELLKGGEYHFIVSDTTRQPRENDGIMETSGTEYWFRTEQEVLADLQAGKFLEAAVIHDQQVSGVSIRELEKARADGKVAITDIEVVGVHTIVTLKPDAVAIFVLPPSFEEWQKRFRGRGDLPPEEIKRRMESAAKEFAAALENPYYKFIVNDTVAHAVEQVHQLVFSDAADPRQQAVMRQLAEKLYAETIEYLKQL